MWGILKSQLTSQTIINEGGMNDKAGEEKTKDNTTKAGAKLGESLGVVLVLARGGGYSRGDRSDGKQH